MLIMPSIISPEVQASAIKWWILITKPPWLSRNLKSFALYNLEFNTSKGVLESLFSICFTSLLFSTSIISMEKFSQFCIYCLTEFSVLTNFKLKLTLFLTNNFIALSRS